MKLTTSILLVAMTAGAAWAQNPAGILQNTKNSLNAAEQKKVEQENAALESTQTKPAAKPSPATPAPKPSPFAAPSSSPAPQVVPAVSKPATPPSAPKNTAAAPAQKKAEPTKISIAPVKPQPPQGSQKPVAHKAAKPAHDPMKAPVAAKAVADAPKPDAAQKTAEADSSVDAVKKDKTITAEGRRDPFLSPVVSRATGPNCSTGKRCLAIDQIMVRGVVKAESGMIAVVVNSLNKAYFLKENDPVYNGYVLRITGDSVVFKETFQDRLGKEATREVVKKITTPAV